MMSHPWVRMVCALTVAFSAPAVASVDVCNARNERVTVAIATAAMDPPGESRSEHDVAVEGWWTLSSGECKTLSNANAAQNWLYFYAHNKSGATMEGSARLCVRDKAFSSHQLFLMGEQTCKGGWREAGFVRRESSKKNFRFTVK